MTPALYLLENRLLELALHLLALVIGARLAVESHERTEVELGGLEELDLADVNLFISCQSVFQFCLASCHRAKPTFWRG